MGSAGIVIAAPIRVLLLLTMAHARLHEEGGRCMAAQQRLAKLRAEMTEAQQDIEVACAAGVATDAPHVNEEEARATFTIASTSTAAAIATTYVPGAQALGVPYTAAGHRRRQTFGKPCAPPITQTPRSYVAYRVLYENCADSMMPVARSSLLFSPLLPLGQSPRAPFSTSLAPL